MFDYNGDGILDLEEFERVRSTTHLHTSISMLPRRLSLCASLQVTEVLRSNSYVGMRHRDHSVTGNTIKSINTGLTKFFFGDKLDQKLTIEKFLEFQKQLLLEILKIEVSGGGGWWRVVKGGAG